MNYIFLYQVGQKTKGGHIMSYYERRAFLEPENYRGTKKACAGNDGDSSPKIQTFEVYRGFRSDWKKTIKLNADISERECRNLMEALRNEELIRIAKEGATITYEGSKVLEPLGQVLRNGRGKACIASKLAVSLNSKCTNRPGKL